jgi:hypothetical protein
MLFTDLIHLAERWLSGRKQRFAKPSYGQKLYRGFESPPLRQSSSSLYNGFLGLCSRSCPPTPEKRAAHEHESGSAYL